MLFLGLVYVWSVFIAPLEETFGWVRSETSLVFTISISSFCIGGIIAGVLIKKTSYRTTLYTSAFLILAGFLGATRISTLLGIYITYGGNGRHRRWPGLFHHRGNDCYVVPG